MFGVLICLKDWLCHGFGLGRGRSGAVDLFCSGGGRSSPIEELVPSFRFYCSGGGVEDVQGSCSPVVCVGGAVVRFLHYFGCREVFHSDRNPRVGGLRFGPFVLLRFIVVHVFCQRVGDPRAFRVFSRVSRVVV